MGAITAPGELISVTWWETWLRYVIHCALHVHKLRFRREKSYGSIKKQCNRKRENSSR